MPTMRTVEASADVPLSPEETWDFFWEDPRQTAKYLASSATLQDYEIRPDGTPRYRMVQKLGPLPPVSSVSEYDVFDRPRRHVNRTLEFLWAARSTAPSNPRRKARG